MQNIEGQYPNGPFPQKSGTCCCCKIVYPSQASPPLEWEQKKSLTKCWHRLLTGNCSSTINMCIEPNGSLKSFTAAKQCNWTNAMPKPVHQESDLFICWMPITDTFSELIRSRKSAHGPHGLGEGFLTRLAMGQCVFPEQLLGDLGDST